MASTSHADQHRFERIAALVTRFVSYLIYIYLVLVEIFLGIAFFLLLFGANQDSSFVRWIYRSATQAMNPFRGVFQQFPITNNVDVAAVFDPSIILAMIVYGVVAIGLHSLVHWLTSKIRQIDIENRLARQHEAYREGANSFAPPPPDVMGQAAGATPAPPTPGTAAPDPGGQQ